MPATVNVRADRNIGLLVRGLGRLALEDQNFAQSDQQRCNESEPSVTFHGCLRGVSFLLWLHELYRCPVEWVLHAPLTVFQKTCSVLAA